MVIFLKRNVTSTKCIVIKDFICIYSVYIGGIDNFEFNFYGTHCESLWCGHVLYHVKY